MDSGAFRENFRSVQPTFATGRYRVCPSFSTFPSMSFPSTTAPYFKFEADFVATQRCIPMCMRYKLDMSGVKLKLGEWAKLDPSYRERLCLMPFLTASEVYEFGLFLIGLVVVSSGAAPELMDPPERIWDTPEVPAQVADKAKELGKKISNEDWKKLNWLQRFALIKLSRPGHEGKNFVPALEEFGIKG
jgi:hypothetical protein